MLTSKLGCYHKNISKGQKGKLMFAEKGKKLQAKLIFNQSHEEKKCQVSTNFQNVNIYRNSHFHIFWLHFKKFTF